MTSTAIEGPPKEFLLPVAKELLVNSALTAHRQFDRDVWMIAPSYHNEDHIQACLRAVTEVFTAAKAHQDIPFPLTEKLQKWNSTNLNAHIFPEDAELAFRLTFACHDLGNITRNPNVTFTDQGEPEFEYADKYEAEGNAATEIRSADIAEKLIDHFFSTKSIDTERINSVKSLVRHLIMQTVFDPTQTKFDEPFWQIVQYIDQIASYSYVHATLNQTVAGLLNEMKVRGAKAPNLYDFLNFPRKRAEALVPDAATREQVAAFFKSHGGKQDEEQIPDWVTPDQEVNYETDIPRLLV